MAFAKPRIGDAHEFDPLLQFDDIAGADTLLLVGITPTYTTAAGGTKRTEAALKCFRCSLPL